MITWLLISIMMRYPPGTFCAIICTWILKEMADFQFVNAFGYSKHNCVENVETLFNMAAVSKWLPVSPFWPTIHISAAIHVKWAEVSWRTSFFNKNDHYHFDSFLSCTQNSDLSKWRPSESSYINKCEPVSWEKGFQSTKMSWIEARDTCLWQSSKSYTLHISSDSIWPLVSLISFCNIQGVFFKKKLWRFR